MGVKFRSLYAAALVLCLLSSGTHAANVWEICYNGIPSAIGEIGPNPTAICRFAWQPGGTGTVGKHKITLSSPNPGLIGGTAEQFYNIVSPTGQKYGLMTRQCVNPNAIATLQGWATAYRVAIRDGPLIPTNTDDSITGGTYQYFCPPH
jgi:hypothetical protein